MNLNCNICDKTFSGLVCFQQHEASEKHKNKVKLFQMKGANGIPQTPGSSIESQPICCDICAVNFIGLSNYQKHVNSLEHVDMFKKKNESCVAGEQLNCMPGKSEWDKESNPGSCMPFHSPSMIPVSYAKCEVCNKNFSGPEPYQQHLASEKHMKKSIKNQLLCNQPNFHTVDSDKIVPIVTQENNVSKNEASGTNEFYAECSFCNMQFSGPKSYQLHVESEEHQKKIAINFNSNIQSSGDHNNSCSPYRCDVCDKDFTGPIPYNDHMISKAHKKKVQNVEFLKNFRSPTALQSDSTTQVPDNLIQHNNEDSSTGNRLWYCEVCKKQSTGPIPHEMHLASEGHHKNARAMEMESNLKIQREALIQQHVENELKKGNLKELSTEKQINSSTNNNYNDKGNEIGKDFYIHKDLILCDALKNIGVIPEKDLNVTIFYPEDEIVFA